VQLHKNRDGNSMLMHFSDFSLLRRKASPYTALESLSHGALTRQRMREIVRTGWEKTLRNSKENKEWEAEREQL
jgi:hypothetical protein